MGFEGRQYACCLLAYRVAPLTEPGKQALQQINPVLGVHAAAPALAGESCVYADAFLPRLALGAAARWVLMRSNSTLAGSSFGSCGTRSPRKALARMLWVRWSMRLLAEATLASSWSAKAKSCSTRRTISVCSCKLGKKTGRALRVPREANF